MKRMRYFGIHNIVLQIIGYGLFPDHDVVITRNLKTILYYAYSLFTALFLSTHVACQILGTYSAWTNERDSNYQFLSFVMPGIVIFTMGKFFTILYKNAPIRKIMKLLEVDTQRFRGDPEVDKYCNSVINLIFYSYFSLVTGTVTSIDIYTALSKYQKDQYTNESNHTLSIFRDPPFPVFSPWDPESDGFHGAVYAYSLLGIFWLAYGNVFGDMLIICIIVHCAGHFKKLRMLIENIGNDALDTMVSKKPISFQLLGWCDGDLKKIKNKSFHHKKKQMMKFYKESDFNDAIIFHLNQSIEYHQLIISIIDKLQKAYTYGFLCQILSSFFVIAVLLAQTAQNTRDLISIQFLNSFTFLLSILCQLFAQTYSANEMTLQAARIAEGAYNSPWYEIEKDNGKIRRLLILLMMRAQRPIILTAANFIPMSNDLFVAIVRRSYEIFTLIRTTISSDE